MNDDREKLRAWVKGWEKTGKFLEELRRKEIRESNLAESILILSDACESALYLSSPQPTSGLIEMQALFSRLKKK